MRVVDEAPSGDGAARLVLSSSSGAASVKEVRCRMRMHPSYVPKRGDQNSVFKLLPYAAFKK